MEKSRKEYGIKTSKFAKITILIIIIAFSIMLSGYLLTKILLETNTKETSSKEKTENITNIVETKTVVMPKVVGMTFEEAKAELEKLNLKVEKIETKSRTVIKGYVIKQEPIGTIEIETGSTVLVYVSIGNE